MFDRGKRGEVAFEERDGGVGDGGVDVGDGLGCFGGVAGAEVDVGGLMAGYLEACCLAQAGIACEQLLPSVFRMSVPWPCLFFRVRRIALLTSSHQKGLAGQLWNVSGRIKRLAPEEIKHCECSTDDVLEEREDSGDP